LANAKTNQKEEPKRRTETKEFQSTPNHSKSKTIMAAASGRLVKELKECGKEDTSGVQAILVDAANIRHLKGNIKGPEGSVYDGGIFYVDILIPPQYPFEPPKMKFITKVFHPNISSQTGAICLVRLLYYRYFAYRLLLYRRRLVIVYPAAKRCEICSPL
jgi:ubiquitin-protein ligase